MNKSVWTGALLCAGLISLGLGSTAHAALVGVLPATVGGTDYQAYYDDQLDISWTANASINGRDNWDNQLAWAANLDIDGVTGWRLPSMDVNGDDFIVSCSTDQATCKDNEYGHLFNYGAGAVFGSGISGSSPGPFSSVQTSSYWSSSELISNSSQAWLHNFFIFGQGTFAKSGDEFAWAVHSGNVSAVPVPAAAWLFGSGLMGLLGLARRKKACP